VVLGAQFGDEGKGKLADVLQSDFQYSARYNGGANAGHTLVVDGKRYAFHLLPCGLIQPTVTGVIGNGVVTNLTSLFNERTPLHEGGIDTRGRLKVSDRSHLLFDFHKQVDGLLESRRAGDKLGTTKQGIGPAYASKMTRNNVRVGMLKEDWEVFERYYLSAAEAHEMMFEVEVDTKSELERIKAYRAEMLEEDMITDTVLLVNKAYNAGERILVEGANAAMLDIDYGSYPFVTSSTTTAGGVCTGLGLSPEKIDCRLGVVKAYQTRVGSGPFPTELTDDLSGGDLPRGAPGTEIGAHLQKVGGEIGVTTGRKRRCGWIDIPLLQYSHLINNYSSINITKLDVLDDLEEIKICVQYRRKSTGEVLPAGAMPSTIESLYDVEAVYESMPGWAGKGKLSECSAYDELPTEARNYLDRIEKHVGCPITWIGVGPGREQMVTKGF